VEMKSLLLLFLFGLAGSVSLDRNSRNSRSVREGIVDEAAGATKFFAFAGSHPARTVSSLLPLQSGRFTQRHKQNPMYGMPLQPAAMPPPQPFGGFKPCYQPCGNIQLPCGQPCGFHAIIDDTWKEGSEDSGDTEEEDTAPAPLRTVSPPPPPPLVHTLKFSYARATSIKKRLELLAKYKALINEQLSVLNNVELAAMDSLGYATLTVKNVPGGPIPMG